MEGNKLVSKISNLVEEDRIVALREVLVRVNELREHFGFLSFGEMVELVSALNKLEKCKEMVAATTEKQRLLWDLVSEVKEKIEKMMFREEGTMMSAHKATKSYRFCSR